MPEWRVGQRTIVKFETRSQKNRQTLYKGTHSGKPNQDYFTKTMLAEVDLAHLRSEFRWILAGINLLNPSTFSDFNLPSRRKPQGENGITCAKAHYTKLTLNT